MEKDKTKNIIIIILVVIIIGLVGYIVYNQRDTKNNNSPEINNKNNNNENNNKDDKKEETNTKDDNEVIETTITKEKANEQLLNSIGSVYYALNLTSNKVNENVFDSDYAKLYLAYMTSIKKDGYISEECYDGEEATGCAAIDLKKFESHYYNLYGEKFENNKYEELNKEGSYIGYRDNKFFGSFPTGLQDEIILKATNIIEKKKTIEVDVDVLNINEDNDLYNKYYEANVLEYDSKLVVAKYKLILGKNENKTHKIDSFTRIK